VSIVLIRNTFEMETETSPLMRLPVELRLLIYRHLFDDHGNQTIAIRNRSHLRQAEYKHAIKGRWLRSKYRVTERSYQQIYFETTYCTESNVEFHTAIMAANRTIYAETSDLVYGRHSFDFGPDIEAVVPFFQDRSPETRAQIGEISVRKKILYSFEGTKYEWRKMFLYLRNLPDLRRLSVTVEGGRPTAPWDGPKELLVSDMRLLWMIKHDSMEWVNDMANADGLEQIVIVPEVNYMPAPKTSAALLHAAFSASISTSLVEFLRSDLHLAARTGTEQCSQEMNRG